MSPAPIRPLMPMPTRFLIAAPGSPPEPLFLHVFDEGEDAAEMDWSPARHGALQFGSRDAAARFAAAHRLGTVDFPEHPAAELAVPVAQPFDRAAAVA